MKQFRMAHVMMGSLVLIALAGAGCENKEAIQALQELTGQLAEKAAANHETLLATLKEANQCKANLARWKGQVATVSEPTPMELPTLGEEINLTNLETYKKALNETIEKQTTKLEELKTESTSCAEEIVAVKRRVARQRAATAAQQGTTSTTDPADADKPTAVKKAEEAGTATKGVKSRYKKRTQ